MTACLNNTLCLSLRGLLSLLNNLGLVDNMIGLLNNLRLVDLAGLGLVPNLLRRSDSVVLGGPSLSPLWSCSELSEFVRRDVRVKVILKGLLHPRPSNLLNGNS